MLMQGNENLLSTQMEMIRTTIRRPARLSLLIVLVFCSFLTVYIFKGPPKEFSSEETKQSGEIVNSIHIYTPPVPIIASCAPVIGSDTESPIQLNQSIQDELPVEADIPIIYVVTPTYKRPTQLPDMTRLSQTLSLVPNIHWVVVEDAIRKSRHIEELLNRTPIPYTHLVGPTPGNRRMRKHGKGVAPRVASLKWLRQNVKEGVLYFADDDNAYDLRIFEEIRYTKKVAVFPVGSLGVLGLSSPILKNGVVVGFHDPYHQGRKYVVDMAGFSVNIQLLLEKPRATMIYKIGHLEDVFLRGLGVDLKDLEPKAKSCTLILVWHTKTGPAPLPKLSNMQKEKDYNETNLPELYKSIM